MKYLFYVFLEGITRYFRIAPRARAMGTDNFESAYCSSAISAAINEKGRRWLIPVNIALFLPGFLLTVAADVCSSLCDSLPLGSVCLILVSVFFIFKFDAWAITDPKCLLKLIFILSMLLYNGYTSLTYLFLIIFENMVATSATGGI